MAKKLKSVKIKQAVILAGGQGMRLRPLTEDRPKPMVLINKKPFLEYLINLLKKNGIEEIILLLGYMPEKVIEYFGDGSRFGLKIKYSISSVEEESGTRVRRAAHLLDDNFMLLYCDNYWPLDLKRMVDAYEKSGVLAMMTVYNNKNGDGEYGFKNNIHVAETGHVIYYGPYGNEPWFQGLDIGFFILNRKIIKMMPRSVNFSFQNTILVQLIDKLQLSAYRTDSLYYTITNPELVKKTEKYFKEKNIT